MRPKNLEIKPDRFNDINIPSFLKGGLRGSLIIYIKDPMENLYTFNKSLD
jgi:hypothetical protein